MAKSKREFIVIDTRIVFTDCIESIIEEGGFLYVITNSGNRHLLHRDISKDDLLKAMGDPVRKG